MAEKGTKEKLDIELEAPADFTSPEVLYQDLINTIRKYHPSDDITMIEKAYRIADEAHKGQARKSGEAYIIHPLYVSIILADLELDKETIVAGLLHDVVEDTIMTDEEIRRYADSGEPMDKAGAYAIQGLCAAYIQGICGDYNNVVGLPVGRVCQELKKRGLMG